VTVRSRLLGGRSGAVPATQQATALFTVPVGYTVIIKDYIVNNPSTTATIVAGLGIPNVPGLSNVVVGASIPPNSGISRPGSYVVVPGGKTVTVFTQGASAAAPKAVEVAVWGVVLQGDYQAPAF
jgi:hypothetical protein